MHVCVRFTFIFIVYYVLLPSGVIKDDDHKPLLYPRIYAAGDFLTLQLTSVTRLQYLYRFKCQFGYSNSH